MGRHTINESHDSSNRWRVVLEEPSQAWDKLGWYILLPIMAPIFTMPVRIYHTILGDVLAE